ncbi:MAG TPA: hypothetical protein VIM06_09235 [Rhodanobacter sp.]
MNTISDRGRLIVGVVVVAMTAGLFSMWTLDTAHFFYADDWDWLSRSQFGSWGDLLHLFPQKLYNDRPGGQIFVKLMNAMVGLDYRWYNALWLLVHMFNCALFFVIAARVVPFNRALLSALVSACWFATLGAVTWVAAIFDLAGTTWCLLAVFLYSCPRRTGYRSMVPVLGAIVFHLLAIRTKEFALALVVVLAAWDFLAFAESTWRGRLVRLAPHLLVTLIYGVVYLNLYWHHASFVSSGPYRMSLTYGSIASGIAYYASGAFYAGIAANTATHPVFGLGLALVVVLLAMTSRTGRAALIAAIALSSAVLLLSQQRAMFYLYAPHFFLALALCSVAARNRVLTLATMLAAGVLVWWPIHAGILQNAQRFALVNGAYSKTLFGDYAAVMRNEPAPRHVTLIVSKPYFDPFTYGPGNALRLLYGDPSITADVLDEKNAGVDPCAATRDVCLVEVAGHLVRRR